MFRRLSALLALAVVLLAAAPARAQDGSPFDGLPPAPPTPAPTVEPARTNADDDVGRATLFAIGGALVVAFAVIGLWIARDARRSLPRERRDDDVTREAGPHRKGREAKSKAREKARRARAARKRNQRTRR